MNKDHHVSQMSFQAISRAWKGVDQVSRKEPGPMRVEISPTTNMILLWNVRTPDTGKKFSLDKLKGAVKELNNYVKNSFEAFIPALTLSKLKEEFKLDQISDNPGDQNTLFHRDDNHKYLNHFATELNKDLFSTSPNLYSQNLASSGEHSQHTVMQKKSSQYIFDTKKAWRVLEFMDKFTDALVVLLFYIVGIPPRAWQIEELLFDSDHGLSRMFKKLQNDLFALGNPKAKQYALQEAVKQFKSFWGLTDDYAWYLIILIGVIRPVQITLLGQLHELTIMRKSSLASYIFVRVTTARKSKGSKHAKFTYDGDLVNKLLKASAMNLTARELRHIFIALCQVKFPEFTSASKIGSNSPTSVMNLQAQHNNTTGKSHYARNSTLDATGYMEAEIYQMLALSYNIQYLLGVRTQFPKVFAAYDLQDFFRKNHLRGFLAAQEFVHSLHGYDLDGTLTRKGILDKCLNLQRNRPYLFGEECNASVQIYLGSLVQTLISDFSSSLVINGK